MKTESLRRVERLDAEIRSTVERRRAVLAQRVAAFLDRWHRVTPEQRAQLPAEAQAYALRVLQLLEIAQRRRLEAQGCN